MDKYFGCSSGKKYSALEEGWSTSEAGQPSRFSGCEAHPIKRLSPSWDVIDPYT